MYLENVVMDALAPREVGQFWEAVVGGETLTDEAAGFETRLTVEGGPVLDLCFQPVPEPSADRQRLQLDVAAGDPGEVDRLLALGARRLDAGDGDAAVLADPQGNRFCVRLDGAAYGETGPVAALVLASADVERDTVFWSWLTGWDHAADRAGALRHPSALGPLLELRPERSAKQSAKNSIHLDVRLESGDDADALALAIGERGGRELHFDWGELPWRHFADPSGNEFCVLPSRS